MFATPRTADAAGMWFCEGHPPQDIPFIALVRGHPLGVKRGQSNMNRGEGVNRRSPIGTQA
eukprot:3441023-Alexandrium_andersonii.AAC.1